MAKQYTIGGKSYQAMDIDAANDSDPYFYASGVVGYMYQSVDGGNTWQGVEVSDTNTGLFDLVCCDVNQYWAVGEDGFVTKISGPVITAI